MKFTLSPHNDWIGLLLLFLPVAGAYLHWGWTNEIYDLGGDGAGYMLAAQYLSPFHNVTPVLADYAKAIIYPPLFPFLIGLLGASLLAGHLLVVFSLLGSIVLFYLWLRAETVPAAICAAAALLFAVQPGTYLQALNIWTENTFLLFSLLAFFAVSRAETEQRTAVSFWGLAAFGVSAATLTRVAALPLLLAFCAYVAMRRPRHWLLLALCAGLPFGSWLVWSKLTQIGISAYTSHWAAAYATDPLGVFTAQLKVESLAIVRAWAIAIAGDGASELQIVVVLALGSLGLAGWLMRLAKLRFDALYFSLYAVVLLIWPHPEEALRYSYVLFPLLLAYAILAASHLGKSSHPLFLASQATTVLLGATALSILPSLLTNAAHFLEPVEADIVNSRKIEAWYSSDRKQAWIDSQFHHRLAAHMKEIAGLVPPQDCILSIKTTTLALHSGRTSYPLPRADVGDEEFAAQMGRCHYAYVMSMTSPSYRVPFYPLDRLDSGTKILSVTAINDSQGAAIVGALIETPRDR